jgi:hypothetical protein
MHWGLLPSWKGRAAKALKMEMQHFLSQIRIPYMLSVVCKFSLRSSSNEDCGSRIALGDTWFGFSFEVSISAVAAQRVATIPQWSPILVKIREARLSSSTKCSQDLSTVCLGQYRTRGASHFLRQSVSRSASISDPCQCQMSDTTSRHVATWSDLIRLQECCDQLEFAK